MSEGGLEEGRARVERLFDAYLAALEEGRDDATQLLERAGDERAELEARILAERELRTLAHAAEIPRDAPRLGRFLILGLLGQGGVGRVHLAYDPRLARKLALKVLEQRELLDKEQGSWILNEARALARISHPGVVRVFEVGEAEGLPFVTMEHLPGPSLADLVREWRRQREESRDGESSEPEPSATTEALAARLAPYSARVECLALLAEALAHCHDRGVLHRDVKPQNVLFDGEGKPRWIDFGLAHDQRADEDSRLGLTTTLVGTAAYLAPEQAARDQTGHDPRSDQFSFATLAYECCALENPFRRKGQRATLAAVEAADPPPLAQLAPAVPPDLARVIRHAHALEPSARYPGMGALAADLRAILANRPVSTEDPSLAHLARLWLRRHRRGASVAAATLFLALVAFLALFVLDSLRARRAIRADLATLRFGEPAELLATFDPLRGLQQRARELDGSLLRRGLIGSTVAEVDRVADRWSRTLRETCSAERAERARLGLPEPVGLYPKLFQLDALLRPDERANDADRLRGTVRFPEPPAGHVMELCVTALLDVPPPAYASVFRATPRVAWLVPGTYWLRCWEPGAERLHGETVFRVPTGWPPERILGFPPPHAELVARAPLVPASYAAIGAHGRVRVPSFRALDHLVTSAELDLFLQVTGFAPAQRAPSAPDEPAWCDIDTALEFASWAGGRLPTLLEFRAAEGVAFPVQGDESPAAGEYYLGQGPKGLEPQWQSYADPTRQGLSAAFYGDTISSYWERTLALGSLRVVLRKLPPRRVGFRVVFAADTPAAYQRFVEEPLERAEGLSAR
ncbi:MAG TPA: serine/threonine-protein kinase [Planctomycetota bacterium]